jgi:GxxExxY protein
MVGRKRSEAVQNLTNFLIMHENDLARIIVDSAFKVHTVLGPGLLETVYQFALNHELNARGISTHRERPIPVLRRA